MEMIIQGLKCFVLAVFCGLLPFVIGFALGWIMRGEKDN